MRKNEEIMVAGMRAKIKGRREMGMKLENGEVKFEFLSK
jgi:hypothetical protein